MKIYMLGIAGTAMGNAALLFRSLGHEISGCDQAIYPPMSTLLEEAGVTILEGYDVQRLVALKPDLVVIGNAYSRGNPEVEFLLEERCISYCSLPEAIAEFALSDRINIVVTGTHGKTTTTAITSYLLEQAGAKPGYMIGGAPLDPERGWALGEKRGPFVIEGDEYDSAFFDKRSKFIHYQPRVAILNNLEFDHADIFRDLADVQRSFSHFLRLVPQGGFVLANADDANLAPLLDISWTTVLRVGCAADADLRIENYRTTETGSRFELYWRGDLWARIEWGMTGLFNARNAAMASLAAALGSGARRQAKVTDFDLSPLSRFRGVRRRQQLRFESETTLVIEDFGHHATAIRDTLEALRARYPEPRIVACFEPRSNTSRLEQMRAPTVAALSLADEALVGAVKQSKMGGVELMDTASLAADLQAAGTAAQAFTANADLLAFLQAQSDPAPRLVIFFTNGSFDGVIDRFVASLEAE